MVDHTQTKTIAEVRTYRKYKLKFKGKPPTHKNGNSEQCRWHYCIVYGDTHLKKNAHIIYYLFKSFSCTSVAHEHVSTRSPERAAKGGSGTTSTLIFVKLTLTPFFLVSVI